MVTISDEFELEFSGSSQAELGHFNFLSETELTISTSLSSDVPPVLLISESRKGNRLLRDDSS